MSAARALARHRLRDEGETDSLAIRFAKVAKPGDVIVLFGDLGAGKSHFARAFIRALTSPDQDVPSPTYTIVQSYEAPSIGCEILHADLFRLASGAEFEELGLAERFDDSVLLIEWPDRAADHLPGKALEIRMTFCDKSDERLVTFLGDQKWAERLYRIIAMETA